MAKTAFIGGGISALFAQLLHWKEGDFCAYFNPSLTPIPNHTRRKNLEIKKLFAPNAPSMGSTAYQLHNSVLHDRNLLGGNSQIWGGFFDKRHVFNTNALFEHGIRLVDLSKNRTGSISNRESIVQLQNQHKEIICAANYLKPGSNFFLNSFELNSNNNIKLNFSDLITRDFDQAFICTGVVQTIDLLMRSGFLKTGDILSLDEFRYELHLGSIPKSINLHDSCIISYSTTRAASHLLGIQKHIDFSPLSHLFVHQVFLPIIDQINLLVGENSIRDVNFEKKPKFGESIHYCNLKINGVNLRDFGYQIHPNLHFVGMGSVKQNEPGPISSQIYRQLEEL